MMFKEGFRKVACLSRVPAVTKKKKIVEELWRQLFSDPSQWWDHRSEKVNSRFPDFKHKKTNESLWLNGRLKPLWVETALAAMAPGSLQLNIFSWNKWLAKYVKAGKYAKAMEVFQDMQREGMNPDKFTFVSLLNACAALRDLDKGREIHAQILQRFFESDVSVGNSLIDMYAKCRSIGDARRVFDKMPTRDLVSWNVMIQGHAKCNQGQEALEIFAQMGREGVEPDSVTFVGVLNGCASAKALDEGTRAHQQIMQRGWETNIIVASCLVHMYAKCKSIENAREVFDQMPTRNVVAWTAMILGYVNCSQVAKAMELCMQMRQEGLELDTVAFVAALNACANAEALEEGRHVHEQVIERGLQSDLLICSSLVDMYAKCGRIEDAWRVFNKMPSHDVVTWSAMILGYVKCGQGRKALELSRWMQSKGVQPDHVTFLALLNTCSSLAALEEGRHVHRQIIQRGCESYASVGNSLVDMYCKCGSIEDALQVFDKLFKADTVSWNAMLGGYSIHGHAKEALGHFNMMLEEGVEMDMITFASLLSACSHGGLVDEALCYFESINLVHNISPTVQHYACIVDLFSRAGRLHEAEDVIRRMPYKVNSSMWMSLLGACRVHGNLEIAERIGHQVLGLDPENAGCHTLLSNIYAAVCNCGGSVSLV